MIKSEGFIALDWLGRPVRRRSGAGGLVVVVVVVVVLVVVLVLVVKACTIAHTRPY